MEPKTKMPSVTYNPEWVPEGMPRERWRCVENASDGLRVVGACHDIARAEGFRWDHTGWHMDPLGDGELAVGYVLQLPSRDREPQYVPAIADPRNPDCFIANFHSVTTDKRDAMHWADGMAESYAEAERDYLTRDAAERAIEELRESICTARGTHRALIAAINKARAAVPAAFQAPLLCSTLRDALIAQRDAVRSDAKRIRALTADPFDILN